MPVNTPPQTPTPHAPRRRELLALAAQYEESMPSFAAELRAANARRNG